MNPHPTPTLAAAVTARLAWRKASYSNPSLNCVELARLPAVLLVRDSKAVTPADDGPILVFPATALRPLLREAPALGRRA